MKLKTLKTLKLPSVITLKKAVYRALIAMAIGACSAFILIPVNLEQPRNYFLLLCIGIATGALMGLQKFLVGYIKYDI